MKTLLTASFFIFSIFNVISQSSIYHPLPDDNAIWREYFGGYQSGCSDYQLILTGDTTFDGLIYKKIQESGVEYYVDQWGMCTGTIAYYFSHYVGAYRNDSLNRMVYFRDNNANTDELLYDFNLSPGDTLPITYTNHYLENYVKTIDSVQVGNEYHKQYGIASFYDTTEAYVYLIEGIGSTFGLLSELFIPFEFGTMLYCFKEDGMTLYYPDSIYPCDLITGLNNDLNENQIIRIYPNPFSDYAKIQIIENLHNLELYVFDIYGREVLKLKNVNNTSIIKKDNLVSGLYVYRLVQNNRILRTGKFIVL